jgi:arylsulfate sulfotransferase
MLKAVTRMYRVALIVSMAGLLVACGNSATTTMSSTTPTPPATVSVTVSPASAALGSDQTTQFGATVAGTSTTTVAWSVNGVTGGNATVGTISTDGLYTSPAVSNPQVVTVTATSSADTTKSASASVVLVTTGKVAATANPLVAQYSFTAPTDATVAIQFGPDQTYGKQTWTQPVPAGGGALNMLVAGMRANTTYHMRASVQFANGAQYYDPDQVFTTGALPATVQVPNITITVPPGPQTSPGIEMLDLINAFSTGNPLQCLATDLEGNVIWYYDISAIPGVNPSYACNGIKLLPNGHVKLVIGSLTPNAPESMVQEIDLAGNVIYQLTSAQLNQKLAQIGSPIVSAGFHHDFAILPNGHTVYLVMEQRNETLTGATTPTLVTGDALIDLDGNGNIAWTWSTFDHLDVNYHPFQFPDWTHSNAIIFSKSDSNLILSCRNISAVMKIDYRNGAGPGDILWKLGPNGDFALQNGTASDWFYNQHYPNVISPVSIGEFQLAVWDNGNSRPDPVTGLPCETSTGAPGGGACYSRGTIWDIDEPARTATLAWQDNLSPLFALCCGNINLLSTGNIDLGAGGASFFPSATEALEVTQQPSPQVVWQMNITNQFSYRIVRLPSLYPGVSWAP